MIGNFLPQVGSEIKEAHASSDMLPSDGDAWTENNNSTYPWRFRSPYYDTFSWETDAQNGTYSLRVNHTAAETYICFYLDIGSLRNVSGYDMLFFRFKIVDGGGLSNLLVYLSDQGAFIGNQYRVGIGNPDEGTWLSYVIPLHTLGVYQGTPSLTSIRYIIFYSTGVGLADGTKVYVDAMRFETFSFTSPSRNDLFLPNFYGMFPQYVDKGVVYNGKSYTSVYDFVNIITGSPQGSQFLEGEAIGQDIFALTIAYNVTKSSYIGDKLKAYLNWLLQLQDMTYGAVRNYFSDSSKQFNDKAETVYNGWCLAGLSYYYAVTSNAVVKTAADKMMSFLVNKMWNGTNNSFNVLFKTSTGEVTQYWVSDDEMRDGAAIVGLSAYYRFVSANATVKSVVDRNLNKYLTKPSSYYYNHSFVSFGFEPRSYLRWGFYEAFKAFNNGTYKAYAYYSPEVVAANYLVNENAFVLFNSRFFKDSSASNKIDGWGLANNILLNIHIVEDTNKAYIKNVTERNIWDWFGSVKTSIWAISRYKNSGTDQDKMAWTPTNLFIYATLAKLYFDQYKPTNPYPILTTNEITSSSYSNGKLTLTIRGAGTSTTEVYVGDKGEPQSVSGATSWSYDDSTKILTILCNHAQQSMEIDAVWYSTPSYTNVVAIAAVAVVGVGSILVWYWRRKNKHRTG